MGLSKFLHILLLGAPCALGAVVGREALALPQEINPQSLNTVVDQAGVQGRTTTTRKFICGEGCKPSQCKAGGAGAKRRGLEYPVSPALLKRQALKATSTIKDVNKYVAAETDATIKKELDWSKGSFEGKSVAVSDYWEFKDKAMNPYISGVNGCTAVAVVSENGVWLAHFMETGFTDEAGRASERQSMDGALASGTEYFARLQKYTDAGGALNPKTAKKVNVYVSAPCTAANGVCGSSPTWMYETRLNHLLTSLFGSTTSFEGVTITKRGYVKLSADEIDEIAEKQTATAKGKVLVQYDPKQIGSDFLPISKPTYRVWLESTSYQESWEALESQGSKAKSTK